MTKESKSSWKTPAEQAGGASGTAVVVGASLAGLMAGLALARVGLRVTLVERVGAPPRPGAVLQVDGGAAVDYSATAKFLRQLASGGMRSAEAWSAIESRLRAAVEADPRITLRYDTRVQAVAQRADAAWVVTDKGETLAGDLVIGADGHRSLVRQQVAPHHAATTFAGYLIWVAILDERAIPAALWPAPDFPLLSMPDGIGDFLLGTVIAGPDGSRAAGQRRLGWAWYDNTRNALLHDLGCVRDNTVHHSLTGPDIPAQVLQELARQAAARWPQPWLAATLHSIGTRSLTGIPIAEYLPDRLTQGRLALVGDAAHVVTPITGSGFNTALQDVAALADCLAEKLPGPGAAQALLDYEARRLAPARQAVQAGQAFNRSFGRLPS